MKIVLLGGGGHASDVLAALEATFEDASQSGRDARVIGLLADGQVNGSRFEGRGVAHLGPISDLAHVDATHFVSCVGDPVGRKKLAQLAQAAGLLPCTVVHPRAWVPRTAQVGPGCVILAGSCLSAGARAGAHVLVGQGAIVGHDCVIEPYASVMPGACISGDTFVGECALVGANSTIIEKLSVGKFARVGAGAVVTKDVAEGTTVVGVPARPMDGGLHSVRGIA